MNEIRLTGLRTPFGDRFDHNVPHGGTIADMVEQAGVTGDVRLLLQGQPIPRAGWGQIRPAPGSEIVIRPIPTGGDDKSAGRIIGTIAVMALTSWAGGAAATAMFGKGAAGTAAFSVTSAVVSGAVGYAGHWGETIEVHA